MKGVVLWSKVIKHSSVQVHKLKVVNYGTYQYTLTTWSMAFETECIPIIACLFLIKKGNMYICMCVCMYAYMYMYTYV